MAGGWCPKISPSKGQIRLGCSQGGRDMDPKDRHQKHSAGRDGRGDRQFPDSCIPEKDARSCISSEIQKSWRAPLPYNPHGLLKKSGAPKFPSPLHPPEVLEEPGISEALNPLHPPGSPRLPPTRGPRAGHSPAALGDRTFSIARALSPLPRARVSCPTHPCPVCCARRWPRRF